jgi:glycosyltransferase involved in cell wall biosynthesis
MDYHADTVVLLTTWDRPALLRQSLPQIVQETNRIGAQLVICDDRSSDEETLGLLQSARDRGANVIRNPSVRHADPTLDGVIHGDPTDALRRLATSSPGVELISRYTRCGYGADAVRRALVELWTRRLGDAHVSAQNNNLFGLRHVLTRYPSAVRILKIDDDVAMQTGAFDRMLQTWSQAESDEHDVFAVAGLRTVNELTTARFSGYAITRGVCNVAVLYRRVDWDRFFQTVPDWLVIRKGFDLAFAWHYAPLYRPGAVAVCVTPSVAYHTGRNGLHVRDADLNCEYGGPTHGVIVQ